jgi:hypothetical protein
MKILENFKIGRRKRKRRLTAQMISKPPPTGVPDLDEWN